MVLWSLAALWGLCVFGRGVRELTGVSVGSGRAK